MRTIIWFIYFWLYLLVIWPKMRRAQKLEAAGDLIGRDEIVQRMVRRWAAALLRVAGVTVEVSGLEHIPPRPVVFVCNHQGNFDIPILLANLDHAYPMLAKAELLKVPLIRGWMRLLECVFIDRRDPRQSVAALSQSVKLVKKGYSIVIFPEGTRGKGGPMGEFKYGAFKIAVKAGVPIIPVRIEGSYKVMEKNHNFIRPATVRLTVLPPVETKDLSKEEAGQIHLVVKSLIAAAE